LNNLKQIHKRSWASFVKNIFIKNMSLRHASCENLFCLRFPIIESSPNEFKAKVEAMGKKSIVLEYGQEIDL